MQLIDTHTHIYDSAFAADLAAVVKSHNIFSFSSKSSYTP